MTDKGHDANPKELFDARAVCKLVTAVEIHTPADKTLLLHAKARREYLKLRKLRKCGGLTSATWQFMP